MHPVFDTRIFKKECATLARAGFDVVLVAPHGQDELADGIQIRAVAKSKNRLERIFRTGRRVVARAKQERPLVYHIHDPELLLWTLPLRLSGQTVIYDMHEDLPKSLLTKPWLAPWMRKPLSVTLGVLERLLLAAMPVVFAEHSYARDRQWKKGAATVLNLPLVDELIAIDEPKHSEFTVCYLGSVSPERGAVIMLEAIDLLAKSGRPANFDCIGPATPEHRSYLFDRKSTVEGNVRMDGERVLPQEVWRRASRCHVGLAVLAGSPNHRESYPTKLFEYMALGLPVIASDFPLYRDVVEGSQCGLCIEPKPDQLQNAIAWLQDNPEKAAAFGQAGRKAVKERYNWHGEGQKLIELYRQLLPGQDPLASACGSSS